MARTVTGVDAGASRIKAVTARIVKGTVQVAGFAAVERAGGAQELAGTGLPLKGAMVGLTGRDMMLRYTQVPPAPDWQLRNLMELEIQELSGQSGGELAADYNLLPGGAGEESGMDTVLLALAREAALADRRALVEGAGGSIEAYTPNSIALYNAYLRCGDVGEANLVLIANIGHETMDLALVRGPDLLFARNVNTGAGVLDEAIAAAFNVSARKAESIKRDYLDLDPASKGRYASSQAEKVSFAALGAAGQIAAALQSTLSFSQAQTKLQDLQLERVLLCGGGSRIKGIRAYLRDAVRCPVDHFDPFASAAVDLGALPPAVAEDLERNRAEAVVALGLALGPLDPALYSLEILPESVKKRRRFAKRTVFNVLAGVVAAGFLVWYAFGRKSAAEEAVRLERTIKAQAQNLNAAHQQAQKVIEENSRFSAQLGLLRDRAVPLDGTLAVLRTLAEVMPQDFWIAKIETAQESVEVPGATPELPAQKVQRRLVKLDLKGKEVSSTNLDAEYQRLSEALSSRLPMQRQPSTNRVGGDFKASFVFDFQQGVKEKG
jgi:type IV pilus assembly protein PilM